MLLHTSCTCKSKSCLKLYCSCFAANQYCNSECLCSDCPNKLTNEINVTKAHQASQERRIRRMLIAGCYCKKSRCLKKYCECYKKGVPCLFNCQCEGCCNPYGSPPERETHAMTFIRESINSEQISEQTSIRSTSHPHPPSHLFTDTMLDVFTDLDFLLCDEEETPESPFKRVCVQSDAETQTDGTVLVMTHTVGMGYLDVKFE